MDQGGKGEEVASLSVSRFAIRTASWSARGRGLRSCSISPSWDTWE